MANLEKIAKNKYISSHDEIVSEIEKNTLLLTVNPHSISESLLSDKCLRMYEGPAKLICDGIGWKYILKVFFEKHVPRITGHEFYKTVLTYCKSHNKDIVLIGDVQKLAKLKDKLKHEMCNNIDLIDFPYVQLDSINEQLIDEVFDSERLEDSIAFIFISAPKQELIASLLHAKIHSTFFVPVGAVIDYEIGLVKVPPKFVRILGIEWLHRMVFNFHHVRYRSFKSILRLIKVLIVSK